MFLWYVLVLLGLFELILCQKSSPCPDILQYEPRGSEQDRYYGVIQLQTEEELTGVWLHVSLDREADLLGNWFGEATSSDNKEFIIKNRQYRLEVGPSVSIRFFVKYNPDFAVPRIVEIRLNGKTICSAARTTTTTPPTPVTPYISHKVDAVTPNAGGGNNGFQPINVRPSPPSRPQGLRPGFTGGNNGNNGFGNNNNQPNKHTTPDHFVSELLSVTNSPVQTRPTTNNRITCGKVPLKAVGLIIHGQNTTQGDWPWHVALYYSGGIQLMYTCGGTLVSERHVVTAAHCVTKPQTSRPINAENLLIYLGKYNLIKFGPEVQDREVNEIIVHPDYNPTVFFNDIAILTLSKAAEMTNFVRPACLWSGSTDLDDIKGQLGTVIGWGFDENRKISNHLMQAQMPIVSTDTCIFSNREFFSQFIFEKNFCAGFRNGTSVCNGDSGGGMVFPRRGTSGRDTTWEIRGLVSVGVAQQSQSICDPNHYVVFTDVGKHVDWISSVINRI